MMHLVLDKLGGFPPYADKTRVKIIRRDKTGLEEEIKVDVETILEKGNPDNDVPLEHGDRVIIPARHLFLL